MTADVLIAEVAQLGITLWAESGKLRFRPKTAMTPELAASLKVNRNEVLRALASTPAMPGTVSRQRESVLRGSDHSRRLIGNGFPPHRVPAVPDVVLATPKIACPACGLGRVLPELRILTGGLCHFCWEGRQT